VKGPGHAQSYTPGIGLRFVQSRFHCSRLDAENKYGTNNIHELKLVRMSKIEETLLILTMPFFFQQNFTKQNAIDIGTRIAMSFLLTSKIDKNLN